MGGARWPCWARSADPRPAWAGQLARVRAWYEPQLPRLFEQPAPRRADLEQLERVAMQYTSREAFVTELTLDPPQATGDLSGKPLLDEDYLILSTVHSAKGQEWESVYVLNVTDGSFPSEFATGRAESIDEERRLLYVAMTRARRDLHLIAPVRFYVTQQSPVGDRYVTGARSRFMSGQCSVASSARAGRRDDRGARRPAMSAGRRASTSARVSAACGERQKKKARESPPGPLDCSTCDYQRRWPPPPPPPPPPP